MKTRSLRSLSILFSSMSPSSRLSEVSNRNSKASPNPCPVYRYSSSLENRIELIEDLRRRSVPGVLEGVGEEARNGDGERETAGMSRERERED